MTQQTNNTTGTPIQGDDLSRKVALEENRPLVREVKSPNYRQGYNSGYYAGYRKAKAAIQAHVDEVVREAYDLLYWKYKELNGQSLDNKFVEAYNILMDEATTQYKHNKETN